MVAHWHSSRVPGVLACSPCVLWLFPPGSLVGLAVLNRLGVNKCVNVLIVLCCHLNQGVSPARAYSVLRIYHNPDRDKALTEVKWRRRRIQCESEPRLPWWLRRCCYLVCEFDASHITACWPSSQNKHLHFNPSFYNEGNLKVLWMYKTWIISSDHYEKTDLLGNLMPPQCSATLRENCEKRTQSHYLYSRPECPVLPSDPQ